MRLTLQGDDFSSVMRRQSSGAGKKKKRQPKLALAEIWSLAHGDRKTENRLPGTIGAKSPPLNPSAVSVS